MLSPWGLGSASSWRRLAQLGGRDVAIDCDLESSVLRGAFAHRPESFRNADRSEVVERNAAHDGVPPQILVCKRQCGTGRFGRIATAVKLGSQCPRDLTLGPTMGIPRSAIADEKASGFPPQ